MNKTNKYTTKQKTHLHKYKKKDLKYHKYQMPMPMPILNIAINSCNASLEHQKTPKEHTNKSNIKQLIKRTQFINLS